MEVEAYRFANSGLTLFKTFMTIWENDPKNLLWNASTMMAIIPLIIASGRLEKNKQIIGEVVLKSKKLLLFLFILYPYSV